MAFLSTVLNNENLFAWGCIIIALQAGSCPYAWGLMSLIFMWLLRSNEKEISLLQPYNFLLKASLMSIFCMIINNNCFTSVDGMWLNYLLSWQKVLYLTQTHYYSIYSLYLFFIASFEKSKSLIFTAHLLWKKLAETIIRYKVELNESLQKQHLNSKMAMHIYPYPYHCSDSKPWLILMCKLLEPWRGTSRVGKLASALEKLKVQTWTAHNIKSLLIKSMIILFLLRN